MTVKAKKEFDAALPTFAFYIDVSGYTPGDVKKTMQKTKRALKSENYNAFFIAVANGQSSRVERIM